MEEVRKKIEVAFLLDKMRRSEIKIIWIYEKKGVWMLMRMCERLAVMAVGRGRDMSKKYWRKVI